ncbi:MAG TPA: hypothetical protein VNQ90_15635 [Chthoniobacteraceae bacterium]|nr:hypothetical protein [Chthoniobacteraceae bacterium]
MANNKINPLEKGDSGRTMMHTATANEVIAAINRLLSLQIKPEGAGRVIISDANIVIELKGGRLNAETFALDVWLSGAPAKLNVYADGPPVS